MGKEPKLTSYILHFATQNSRLKLESRVLGLHVQTYRIWELVYVGYACDYD